MQIIRHWTSTPPESHGASVALGNFDGVHLGHLSVLDLARGQGGPLGVVTFEPHPREFFDPAGQPFRLMNAQARANRLARLGVAHLFELSFDTALASLTAEEFARDVLAHGLRVRHVVVGADFCFGKGRKGTVRDLAELGAQHGFGVTVAPLRQMEGQVLSSTAIRAALTAGDMRGAAAMLGHWHRIEGPVLHGDKRGRTLGYPTANMSIAGLHPPRFGVYAVQVDVLSGRHAGRYGGVASMGVRPMFGQNMPNLETHIFDFKGDLYDTHLSVALVSHLRDEARFDGLDALIVQMDRDSAQARAILAEL
jgi:riboflavin kinase/FMN adenylyltransferase